MKQYLASAIAVVVVLASTVAASANAQEEAELEEVIVTGVFGEASLQDAAVAVTVIDSRELESTVAVSAADILKDIPGVFVNSALGEIRNIVYSRGISANSLDGNNGYFYVSLQEDGLPVQNVLATNFGPDYFLRPDLMTRRVEAVRGGSAAITGPNAPGGIFNYLSKTGLSDPGNQVAVRLGSEGGEFGNPYYRADFYSGGALSDKVYYAVGGFYRDGTGPRDPGYSMNRGGQVRANLLAIYDKGRVQLNLKRLNDHNLWDEFTPVAGFSSAQPIGDFDFDSSVNPPRVPHAFPALDSNAAPGAPTSSDFWDPRDGIHNTQTAFGVDWEHEVGNGWSFRNSARFSESESDWNSGAAIFSMSIDVPGIYGPAPFGNGILAVGVTDPAGFQPFPGVISFRDRGTGRVLATVNSDGKGGYTVGRSTLPDAPQLPNAILVQTAFAVNPQSTEFIDQFTLTKEFDNHTFTAGIYYAFSDFFWRSGEGGVGLARFDRSRELLDISIARSDLLDSDGNPLVQQITNPDGFAGIGKIGSFNNFVSSAEQEQISLFVGHSWEVNDRLNINWGARYEQIDVEGFNQVAAQTTDVAGGLDGDPNTLYDNTLQTIGFPVNYEDELNYFAYSAAFAYEWSDRQSTYIRFSTGEKAPSLSAYVDPGSGVNNGQFIPQKVTQLEVGYSYYGDRLGLNITPFLTDLKDVGGFGSPIQFTDVDGTTYVRESLLSSLKTVGVEVAGQWEPNDNWLFNGTLTVQTSESTDNARWEANNPGRADDVIVPIPDGDAANTPNLQGALTARYRQPRWDGFVTFRYMGDRPANAVNSFDLKAFSTVDTGLAWYYTDELRFQLNINNLLNERGVLSWQGAGDFDGLDRNRTPVNELWSVVHQQPRSVFFTASYSF